jgi:hypothetical protein
MRAQQFTVPAIFMTMMTMAFGVPATALAATASGGLTFRLALHPDIASGSGDTEDTETTKTGDDPEETSTSSSTADAKSTQSMIGFGVGYTFPIGLHLGASLWQESRSMTVTEDTTEHDTHPSTYTVELRSKSTMTAIGPTIGMIHASGFSVLLTPFMSIRTKNEDTSSFTDDSDDDSGSTADDPDPTVTDDSTSSGFRIDLGWHARFGAVGIGPELAYTSITTKIDMTTVDKYTRYNGDVETTTTHTTGTSRASRLVPMIGLSLFL